MNTPLQQAAQAMIDRWDSPYWKLAPTADYIDELRKALDAELQQAVEPVLWITDLDDPIICKTEFETANFCEDDQRPIPVYLHPPQQATIKQCLKVGDSRFESWYSELNQAGKGSKQIAREAYEAGLNEADAQQAKRVPLAGDEIEKIADGCRAGAGSVWPHAFARALEARHKILPTEKPTDWGQP